MSVRTASVPLAGVRRDEKTQRHLPGEEGLWVFILGDMAVFALFFGVIVVTSGQQPDIFGQSQAHLHTELGVLNTLFLLTGSLLVARGMRGLRHGGGHRTAAFAGALACAAAFAAVKVVEYSGLVGEGLTPTTNDFFMYYFVFTGIHLVHLLIGAVMLGVLTALSRRPSVTAGRITLAECGAVYWHMVDMLWLVLFPLLYIVR